MIVFVVFFLYALNYSIETEALVAIGGAAIIICSIIYVDKLWLLKLYLHLNHGFVLQHSSVMISCFL